ncbi:MAG: hypothetical protein JWP69_331 [Flaviaesturariibacter sp.]|nr:hypothetical protein [Flaviaesturariibacter sp.]
MPVSPLQKGSVASNDMGPIAWPSMAYMTTDSIKTTAGLRHPSSIVKGDSVYIFYIESGVYKGLTPAEEGRQGGTKLLRVHKDSLLNPHNYQAFYREEKETWNASLPAGFTKENMLQYATVKGPKTTDILGGNSKSSDVVRFSVAKLRNRNGFIGVEEYHNWGSPVYYLALRFSSNLMNWSDRQIIYSAPSWETALYHYPVFLDKEGKSNTEVDEADFFILGTPSRWNNAVNRLRIYQ